MAKILDRIREQGAEVVVIAFAPPERIRAYLERYPQPFPVFSDPDLAAYRAFALGRTRLWSFFRPSVAWRFLKLMFTGWLPRKPAKGDDLMQLGGDFILDADLRLVFAHPSRDAADRPSNDQLLAALAAVATHR